MSVNDIRNLRGAINTSPTVHAQGFHRPQHQPETVSESDKGLLQMIRSENTVPCFGGYLFRRENPQYGHVLCFAVENMSEDDARNADKWYALFGRMSHLGMLHRTSSAPLRVGTYTVFEFVASHHDKSIREMLKGDSALRVHHDALMNNLVKFIHDYREELRQQNYDRYLPLNCLSKDTVMLDTNGRMKVIPLRANRGAYPIEIPREVTAGEISDEASDLFAAAYLAVEVYSRRRGSDKLIEPESSVIRNCVKAVHDWRPSLDDVYAAVSSGMPIEDRTLDKGGSPIQFQPGRIKDKAELFFGRVQDFLREMARPYEAEEAESDFQCEGTMHGGGARQDKPIDISEGDPDGTFSPVSR